ncbi:hypothetical protein V8F20_003921 [Naviculisporaceae sp. PSN 640]
MPRTGAELAALGQISTNMKLVVCVHLAAAVGILWGLRAFPEGLPRQCALALMLAHLGSFFCGLLCYNAAHVPVARRRGVAFALWLSLVMLLSAECVWVAVALCLEDANWAWFVSAITVVHLIAIALLVRARGDDRSQDADGGVGGNI